MKSAFLTAALVALPAVSAHGVMNGFDVNGQSNKGPVAAGPADPNTAIREIFSIDPIKGANNTFLSCGQQAPPAAQSVTVPAGANMSFVWHGGDGVVDWPHPYGPMLTYMSLCDNNDCSTFNSTTAKWFKINEVGQKPNNTAGDWFMKDLTTGSAASVALPSNIAPGSYLIRHELIALHNAQAVGGVEFYAGCTQTTVTGSGTGAPTDSELVTLPGAYTDNDPGLVVDVFTNPTNLNYQFPGPQVAAFVSGADADGSSSSSGNSSGSAGSSTGHSTKKGGSGHCKLKPSATAQAALGAPTAASPTASTSSSTATASSSSYTPRRLSRVMRSIAKKLH